ncbi:ubiquitin family protein [Hibiscus syriacus]|uniref:Ubiquitin family protein n=1 Tax=Hibiscus syriacus TaxID=106335 RepID=A0A6A2ZXK3_HIBSY|nr:ubiquitin family protein [Hibiscus syriacus]
MGGGFYSHHRCSCRTGPKKGSRSNGCELRRLGKLGLGNPNWKLKYLGFLVGFGPVLVGLNGVQNRRNSYEDGVYGTTCPIPPGKNFTYILQVKDQIGSFYYFPSLDFHKAAGSFGGIRILSRPRIPVPFSDPAGDYTVQVNVLVQDLKAHLDGGRKLPFPDGILINGRGPGGASFNVEQGKTYRLRISNVGSQNSLNFRIQNHRLKLVEVGNSHSANYLLLNRSSRRPINVRFIHSNSVCPVSGPIPGGPTIQIDWSLNQAPSIRKNLTASGPRHNPQGSYHYGLINTTRTIILSNSAGQFNGKQRYAVNSVSFVPADTPLKLADYFKIVGVYRFVSISDRPTSGGIYLDTSVMNTDYRAFIEIVFHNDEDIIQSWHLDDYNFFLVGMDGGQWTTASRNGYNLREAVSHCIPQVMDGHLCGTRQCGNVEPKVRNWARRYLGQQFYLHVFTTSTSLRDEYPIPKNALLCCRASGRRTRPV